jgi:hypothetical protein
MMIDYKESTEIHYELIVDNDVIGYVRELREKNIFDVWIWKNRNYRYTADVSNKEEGIEYIKNWYEKYHQN